MLVREKVPAKVNLTLDVLGIEGNYHNIKSLVASINVYDTVTLIKRADKRITLKVIGFPIKCPVQENNAVKAAVAFMKKFQTRGVSIIINKKIPVAGGLGGSSADVVAVLKGMKKLFDVDADVMPIANELGSDCGYMMNGGYAVISGRGTEVERKFVEKSIPLILVSSPENVTAKNCYGTYDKLGKVYPACTDEAEKLLVKGDIKGLAGLMKNDLEEASFTLAPNAKFPKEVLEFVGAEKVLVSGSGPTVYGVFATQSARDAAFRKISPLFGERAIKANTIADQPINK